MEDVSRSPHPRVVARADPHPSTFSPPRNVSFHPLRTKRARACVHACMRACLRACTRAHACLPGLVLKGSVYGEDVRAQSARGRVRSCAMRIYVLTCGTGICPVPFLLLLFFFFFYRRSVSLFFPPSFSPYRSLSVYACLSFSLLKKRRVRDHSRATGRSGCARSVRRACDKYPMSECRPTLDFDR